MDAVVLLLCGLPGAGKTTLAREIVALQYSAEKSKAAWAVGTPTRSIIFEHISFDELYTNSTAAEAFDPVHWKHTQEEMATRVRAWIARAICGVVRVLVVDDNFFYRSMRKRLFQIANEANCGFGILYIHTPVEVCQKRNAARPDSTRVPDIQFERMANAFEPPDPCLSFEINSVMVDSIDAERANLIDTFEHPGSTEKSVLQVLEQAARNWEMNRLTERLQAVHLEQQIEDQKLTAESVVHNFDLASRKWISSTLSGDHPLLFTVSPSQKGRIAKVLNSVRKAKLTELKRDSGHGFDQKIAARHTDQFQDTAIRELSLVLNQHSR